MMTPQNQPPTLRSLNAPTVSSIGVRERVGQCLSMLVTCLPFLPGVNGESFLEEAQSTSSTDWSLVLLLVSVIALCEVCRSVGSMCVKWAFSHRENLKVKVLSPQAVLPAGASNDAAGLDISTIESFVLEPGERRLVSTGLEMALPHWDLWPVVLTQWSCSQHGR